MSRLKPVDRTSHRRPARRALGHSGQGDRRLRLCARCARARHVAWPRGAAALCGHRRRRLHRQQPASASTKRRSRIFRAWWRSSPWAISSASSPSARSRPIEAARVLEGRVEAAAAAAEARRSRHRATRQSGDDADVARQRRRRSPRVLHAGRADGSHLCVAVSDARLDRSVLRGRGRADGAVTVWSGTQNPVSAAAGSLDPARHARGRTSRSCASKPPAATAATAPTTLPPMPRCCRARSARPVRVQLTREQEHAWEPKGAAQLMEISGGLTADGSPAAYDFATRYPSNAAPTLALLLTRSRAGGQSGVRDGRSHRDSALRLRQHPRAACTTWRRSCAPSWLRGVSALPNSFAHESYIDELATAAGVDPVEYRLRYLHDPRAVDLVQGSRRTRRLGAPHRTAPAKSVEGDVVRGQGCRLRAVRPLANFPATARRGRPGSPMSRSTSRTGDVAVKRVVVGQDSGLMINPAGIEHQIHGNVIQSTSRALKEQVSFTDTAVADEEWGAYPILTFPRSAGDRRRADAAARTIRRSAAASRRRCRRRRRSPTRSSTPPACGCASRRSRRSGCAPRSACRCSRPPPVPAAGKKRSWFALAGAAWPARSAWRRSRCRSAAPSRRSRRPIPATLLGRA